MRRFAAALLVVACRPAPAPIAEPQPPQPSPELAPATVSAPEPQPEPPTTELRLEGERIGWVESPQWLETLGSEGERARVGIPFYISEGNRARRVEAEVSRAGLEAGRLPEAEPAIRVAVHHELVFRTDDGSRFAEVRCGEFDVLVEEPLRTRVRIRKRGVVLEGWVEGSVPPRGTADCPPRTIGIRPARISVRGQPPPGPTAFPEGFVEAERIPLRRKGPVWRLQPGEPPVCDRWVWKRGGTRLEQKTPRGVSWYEVDAEDTGSAFTLLGPGWTSKDPMGSSGGLLCAERLVVVNATDDTWTLVSTVQPVVAYHVDDVQRWYRTAAACEAAIEQGLRDHAPGC